MLSLGAFVGYVMLSRDARPSSGMPSSELLYSASQVLSYGLVGAVLVARRPDLVFGWLLSLASLCLVVSLAVTWPAIWALHHGVGGQLAVWALSFGSLSFVPTALQGVINVRFPSGQPSGRTGRVLERLLLWGIAAGLLGGLLGDSSRSVFRDGVPGGASRFIDGSPVATVGNVLIAAVPATILLGILAGLGVVVRCVRADGLERKQLQWRAAGVLITLALFPFAIAQVLPDWIAYADPVLFVTTLVVPVLRYDLWAIDHLIRRSATYTLAASGSVVENMIRAAAEMVHLPYVAVLRADAVLASYGVECAHVDSWPLTHHDGEVGTLVAAPRHGRTSLDPADRQVMATVAQLIAGSVRAEALTADLLVARQRLVTAQEEERRRLRRELHDGLGPLVTGIGLNLDAARSTLTNDPSRAGTYLRNAQEASAQVIDSIREVVYGLRPPALDDLGFVGAVRLQTQRISSETGLRIDLCIPDEVWLPAAVEVAAYRAVIEAVTNTLRHSAGRHATVEIETTGDQLHVIVLDDAVDGDHSQPWLPGVGLTAMRERAEELGGTLEAGPTSAGGCVRLRYPFASVTP